MDVRLDGISFPFEDERVDKMHLRVLKGDRGLSIASAFLPFLLERHISSASEKL